MTAENTTENQEDPGLRRLARAARRTDLAGQLAALRDSAGDAYAAITAAEAELAVIAAERVSAERALRLAAAGRVAAARAAAAHQRARPGVPARLARWLRAPRAAGGLPRWRRQQAALAAAVTAADQPVAAARQALAEVREGFAAQVRARGEAATTLRRLTAQCAAVQAELAACLPGEAPPE
jgi:hypothetical protein